MTNTFTTKKAAERELEKRRQESNLYKNDTVFETRSAWNNCKLFFVGTYHEYKLLCNI